MPQIFVSHSSKDKDLVALLSRAFAATRVKASTKPAILIYTGIPRGRSSGRFLALEGEGRT